MKKATFVIALSLSLALCSLAPLAAAAQPSLQRKAADSGLNMRVTREQYEQLKGAQRAPGFLTARMPRVSGLSVSVASETFSPASYDVDLDVTVTTTRTYDPSFTFSSFNYYFRGAPNSLLLGNNNTTFTYLGTPYYSLTGSQARVFYSTSPNTTNTAVSANFTGSIFKSINTGTLAFYAFQTYLSAQLPIPAIDYGDGVTADQLTLTQPTGTQTSTTTSGAIALSRRWRASLSHSYPGPAPYTVRVASGCCSPGVSTGSGTRATVSTTGTLKYTQVSNRFLLVGSGVVSHISGAFNTGFTGTITTASSLVSSGPFNRATASSIFSSYNFVSTALDQVTAAIDIAPNPLGIPTAGSYGLAALALLLAALGLVILKR